jgi:hypothetical protein
MKRQTKIPVEPKLLEELYINRRLSTIEVAKILSQRHGTKVSHEWVNRWLENLGIPRRTFSEANRLDLPLIRRREMNTLQDEIKRIIEEVTKLNSRSKKDAGPSRRL